MDKNKTKITFFFLEDKSIIVLDEITNALDKQTINEIYLFLLAYIKIILKNYSKHHTQFIRFKNLKGNYYLIEDFKMIRFTNQTEVIQKYIEG